MKAAKMIVDRDYTLARTDDKLFSSFVEPLGRCIYGALYRCRNAEAIKKTKGHLLGGIWLYPDCGFAGNDSEGMRRNVGRNRSVLHIPGCRQSV